MITSFFLYNLTHKLERKRLYSYTCIIDFLPNYLTYSVYINIHISQDMEYNLRYYIIWYKYKKIQRYLVTFFDILTLAGKITKQNIKVVVVGDAEVGKHSLQVRYIKNPLPDQYFQDPLVYNYCSKVTFNGRSYFLELLGISRQVSVKKWRIIIKEIIRKERLRYIHFSVRLSK